MIPDDGTLIGVRVDYRKFRRHGKGKIKPINPREFYGRFIRIVRVALNMSVREFAEFVGIANNTISRIENYRPPNSDTRDAIATKLWSVDDALKLSVDVANRSACASITRSSKALC